MDYRKQDESGIVTEQKSKHMTDLIVDRLITCRKELNMTQQDVADVTMMQRANIARIESKRREASLESLIKYAESLHMQLRMNLEKEKKEHFVSVMPEVDGKKIVFINDIRFKGKRRIDWKEAENCIREYMRSCCEIAEAADKKYLGEQLPEAFAKVKVSCSAAVQIASDSAGILNCKEKQKEGTQLGWYCYDSRVALPVYGADGELERYNVLAVSMLVRLDEDGKKYLYHLQRR